MKTAILLSCIFISLSSFAQTNLRFVNEKNEPVGFVYAFDSAGHYTAAADSAGRLPVPKGAYHLVFDHVSYETAEKQINENETNEIIIVLKARKRTLEEVVIKAGRQKKRKTYEEGSFKRNSPSATSMHQHVKFGIISPHPVDEEASCKLTGIKFKLHTIKKEDRRDFVLEIKIYNIENRLISAKPLNEQPIYVSSVDLKKKNTILFKEFIPIGEEGVFISFEIPEVDSDESVISFAGAFDSDTGLSFFQPASRPNWDANTIKKGGHRMPDNHPYSGKYFTPEISILYQKMN